MRVVTAQLAGGERNADRVLVTDDSVIVLDGATAIDPVDLDPGTYAQSLGVEIATRLDGRPINSAVAGAIATVTSEYGLDSGRSPSSTVSILQLRREVVDLYVLGDSPIYVGGASEIDCLKDDRLTSVGSSLRAEYTRLLRAGHGYSQRHRQLLAQLQQVQKKWRNRELGYWIAEADPSAAMHGITKVVPRKSIDWAVVATDGAADTLSAINFTDWQSLAYRSSVELTRLLGKLHRWEEQSDPTGKKMPRAKVHDDKTVAAISFRP